MRNTKSWPYLTGVSQDFLDLADVSLTVDDGSLPVHSHVLALHSKVSPRPPKRCLRILQVSLGLRFSLQRNLRHHAWYEQLIAVSCMLHFDVVRITSGLVNSLKMQ